MCYCMRFYLICDRPYFNQLHWLFVWFVVWVINNAIVIAVVHVEAFKEMETTLYYQLADPDYLKIVIISEVLGDTTHPYTLVKGMYI